MTMRCEKREQKNVVFEFIRILNSSDSHMNLFDFGVWWGGREGVYGPLERIKHHATREENQYLLNLYELVWYT